MYRGGDKAEDVGGSGGADGRVLRRDRCIIEAKQQNRLSSRRITARRDPAQKISPRRRFQIEGRKGFYGRGIAIEPFDRRSPYWPMRRMSRRGGCWLACRCLVSDANIALRAAAQVLHFARGVPEFRFWGGVNKEAEGTLHPAVPCSSIL